MRLKPAIGKSRPVGAVLWIANARSNPWGGFSAVSQLASGIFELHSLRAHDSSHGIYGSAVQRRDWIDGGVRGVLRMDAPEALVSGLRIDQRQQAAPQQI